MQGRNFSRLQRNDDQILSSLQWNDDQIQLCDVYNKMIESSGPLSIVFNLIKKTL